MRISKSYKTELRPTEAQAKRFSQWAEAVNLVYNLALRARKDAWEKEKKTLGWYEQSKQLTQFKRIGKFATLRDVPSSTLEFPLRKVDLAYRNFFRRIKRGEKPGFPKMKPEKGYRNSFKLRSTIHVDEDAIKLPKVGWVRLKEKGYLPTEGIKILSATVSEKVGRWFVSLNFEQEIEIEKAEGPPIGIDLGITSLAVVSDGRRFENPKALKRSQKRLVRFQKEWSRRKPGSKNREKTRQKIEKLHYRIANLRKDVLHKATSEITGKRLSPEERPRTIGMETLNVKGMVKNRHLARAISDVGMAEFRRQMEYKAEWRGEEIILADRFFPSSKKCSACGWVNRELKLGDRKWTCVECGVEHDRDLNAAMNLRDIATAGSAECNASGGEEVSSSMKEEFQYV